MKDERIQTTIDHIARRAFVIWYVLMLISLDYRLLILKQHPREIWDIFAIFLIANLFVIIACAKKGIFFLLSKRGWLALCIFLFALSFITGQIHSVVDVGGVLIGLLLATGLIFGIAHFLTRRWERKEGIEDEK